MNAVGGLFLALGLLIGFAFVVAIAIHQGLRFLDFIDGKLREDAGDYLSDSDERLADVIHGRGFDR